MKKTIASFIIILLVMLGFTTCVNAAALQANIQIEPDSLEVEAGGTVVFTLTLTNVANAENDIVSAIQGKVTYDPDFFENLTYNSLTMNTETGAFLNSGSFTNNSPLGTITLTVKNDATGSGYVNFTELSADDGRDDYTESTAPTPDAFFTISVKTAEEGPTNPDSDDPETPDEPTNPDTPTNPDDSTEPDDVNPEPSSPSDPIPDDENGENNGNGNGNTDIDSKPGDSGKPSKDAEKIDTDKNTKEETTAKKDFLPNTGMKSIIIPLVIVLIVISVVAYKKYKKLNEI